MTTEYEDLSNEEAIAKFLGCKSEMEAFRGLFANVKSSFWVNSSGEKLRLENELVLEDDILDWLASDAGTVVMICALQEYGHYQKLIEAISAIGYTPETLNTALQAAILEVIKDG